MSDAVFVEKLGNQFRLTVYAESLAEAQCLMNMMLNAKPAEAFIPPKPLTPTAEALLAKQDGEE
jgi:hypothetical protein